MLTQDIKSGPQESSLDPNNIMVTLTRTVVNACHLVNKSAPYNHAVLFTLFVNLDLDIGLPVPCLGGRSRGKPLLDIRLNRLKYVEPDCGQKMRVEC
ncbi:hypothetical protein RRG08_057924 [Elysia crispata]|uniref:Uncharacterized protein n=1 Tax=Elysia crispata TaxID=231223 RepID=A0AAE0ZZP6_9GAST|nr:hypothetical protein RRG08_057924 [Elysia crispata]